MKQELSEFLRPSRAKTWATCLASPGFCFQNQDRLVPFATDDQAEGTRIHAYAAAVLKGIDPKDPEIPPELWEAAMGFVAYVQSIKATSKATIKATIKGAAVMHIERTIPRGYAPGTCTPDVVLYDEMEKHLHIIDLKAGIGVEVVAEGNLQLLLYGHAVIKSMSEMPDSISIHIYMPRHHSGEKSEVRTIPRGDQGHPVPDVISAAQRILASPFTQTFTPSDEACQFCPAQSFCTARAKQATAEALQIAELRAIDLGAFDQLSDEKLAAMYLAVPKAKKFFNKLEAYVESRAATGIKFPGLKMVAGRQGNRQWIDEKKAFTLLRKLFPTESCRHIETISPTEVDKFAKQYGVDITPIEKLIVRPEGAPSLVPESDKREALTETVSAAFQVVE